jgi:hypothetical protein
MSPYLETSIGRLNMSLDVSAMSGALAGTGGSARHWVP